MTKGNNNENMISRRRRKTNEYDTVLQQLGDNIGLAMRNGYDDYNTLSRAIGISPTSVGEWVRKKYLPTVDQLVLLARALNVTVDWLLTPHTFSDEKNVVVTYTQALSVLRPLIRKGLVKQEAVTDYFLSYLLTWSFELEERQNIPNEKLDAWQMEVNANYSVPIMQPLDGDMYAYLEKNYGDVDDAKTHLALLDVIKSYWIGEKRGEIDDGYLNWKLDHNKDNGVADLELPTN